MLPERLIEFIILKKLFNILISEKGYILNVRWRNVTDSSSYLRCTDPATAVQQCLECDDAFIEVFEKDNHEDRIGWIALIMGNGEDVVSDYSVSLHTKGMGHEFLNWFELLKNCDFPAAGIRVE